MKVSTLVMCTLAVVLWVGVSARAEGKGKTSGDKTTVQERDAKANQGQGKAQAGDVTADKSGKGGQVEKQAGALGKKVDQAAAAAEKGKGKGKGQDQQAQALQKQLQHELDKHKDRLAKLNRIRELAAKKNDAETTARVDKLIAKENEVYARKLQQIQGQPRVSPQLQLPGAAGKPAAPTVTPPPSATPAPSTTPAPAAPEAQKDKPAEQPKEKEKEQK